MLNPGVRMVMREDLEESWNAGMAEGIRLGIEEGEERGEKRGAIRSAVRIYRDEMGLDNGTIMNKIAKQYDLTRETAAQYVYAKEDRESQNAP